MKQEQRTYRGDIDPRGLAEALVTRFDHDDLSAEKVRGQDGHLMVQIASRDRTRWGAARTTLSVGIAPVAGGVRVTVGRPNWLDAIASLLLTGLWALFNPRSLLWRMDDIARDVGKLMLPDQVWEAVETALVELALHHLEVVLVPVGVGVDHRPHKSPEVVV